jgi:hypothetical protein
MKRKLKAPPKLTKEETERIDKWIWMDHWHFEILFEEKCIELSSFIIHWNKDGDQTPERAKVYGLRGVFIRTGRSCIANIFIRYCCRLYRVYDISQAAEIVRLLEKEVKCEEYIRSKWRQKDEARRNALAKKHKVKVKKLQVVSEEKVA